MQTKIHRKFEGNPPAKNKKSFLYLTERIKFVPLRGYGFDDPGKTDIEKFCATVHSKVPEISKPSDSFSNKRTPTIGGCQIKTCWLISRLWLGRKKSKEILTKALLEVSDNQNFERKSETTYIPIAFSFVKIKFAIETVVLD